MQLVVKKSGSKSVPRYKHVRQYRPDACGGVKGLNRPKRHLSCRVLVFAARGIEPTVMHDPADIAAMGWGPSFVGPMVNGGIIFLDKGR